MIRCLFLICVVGAVWSRTLDGVGRADLDGPERPHGIEGDQSRGNLGVPCKDCNELTNEDQKVPSLNREVHRGQRSNSHEGQKEGQRADHQHHQRNHHKRMKSSLDRIVKPFLSIGRVKVSVTRNGRRLPIRRLPTEDPDNKRMSSDNPATKRLKGNYSKTRHASNENLQTRPASNENSQIKHTLNENLQTIHAPNENLQTRHASNKNFKTKHLSSENYREHDKSQMKELPISTGNVKPGNIVDILIDDNGRTGRTDNDGKHRDHLPTQRDRGREMITKSNVQLSTGIINSETIREELTDDSVQEDGEKGHSERNNRKAVVGKGGLSTENVKLDAHVDAALHDDVKKHTKGEIHKTNRNTRHKSGRSHRAKSDKSNDKHTSKGNIRGHDDKKKRPKFRTPMETRKINRNAKTRSKPDEKNREGIDNDRQLSEPIKLQTGDRGSSRWKSPDLPQVPDVERLERRLHPKVEAPVEDITMALRRIMHQMQHYIYTTDYNYRHTFNSTRWEIITAVREELLNIAKENDHVYDAVMEVSLHTKELYLRGHQRRQFNEAQAASSLPLTQRPGVQNLYLRSKYEYAMDELRYAQNLKRKVLGLQRKRSNLRYDYTVLTRKISEKLPTQALYDLGRRANQTMYILDRSRMMRDSMDRTRMYGYSRNSTFLDMRLARNHINDADDIIVALKQQYRENHMKAKEIKRLRQTVHVDVPTDAFDMKHVEQWVLVDRTKIHANDLFTTAAMVLMKFKPLLKDANDVIDAAKKGTRESRFEKTIRNIREQMGVLNTTMVLIRGDVCTDQYEVCIPKREGLEELSTDDKLTEEASGDTDQEGDDDDDDVEVSSGDGKVEVTTTSVPKKTTTTEKEEESKSWFDFWSSEENKPTPEETLTTAQSTTPSASVTTPTSTESTSRTPTITPSTTSTTTVTETATKTTRPSTSTRLVSTEKPSTLTKQTSSPAPKTSITTARTLITTSPKERAATEMTSPLTEQPSSTTPKTSTTTLRTLTLTSPSVSPDMTSISSSQSVTSTSRTPITSETFATTEETLTDLDDGKDTLVLPDTDDEDLLDELSGDGSGSGMSMEISGDGETTANNRDTNNKKPSMSISITDDEDITTITKMPTQLPGTISRVSPTSVSGVITEGNIDNKPDKKTSMSETDTDDEDMLDEIQKSRKSTKTIQKTPKPTTTPVPIATTTEAEEEDGWWWESDTFGFLADQVWGSETRHKRDTEDAATAELSNITLTELILEHLRNRSEMNEELLSQAKLRLKSVSDLQNHLDRVKSQIDLYENHTLQVKTYTHTWKAEAAVFRAVHNRVNDVSKDVDFKHSVFQEQNAKSIKKAEAKLKRMQDAYEANKERITDNSGPESANEALELAQKVKDNIGAIVSLKQLNPSPCQKFQSMDNMIRANISELRHKIKQAKLLAASLQVAVTMEGSSHLEIPVPGLETNKQASTKVELSMKTYSEDGLVALVQTNKTGAVALTLDEFVPKITILDNGQYNLGENSADLPLKNNTWYKFTIERFASDYNVTVYKGTSLVQSFITTADEDYPTVYNAPSSVFIGGATDKYDMDDWTGCIGSVHINGKYLNVLTTDNKKTLPKSSTVLDYKEEMGLSIILDGNGYALYDLNNRQQRSRVTSFAANFTAQSSGTVFSMNAENNRFKTTAFVKGRQLFVVTRHYGLKSDVVSVSDVIGTEQSLEVSSDGRSINVMLNGRTDRLTSSVDTIDVFTSQRIGIYLGSSSNTSRSIRGCVHGLSLNNVDIPLNSMSDAVDITYGHCRETNCLSFNTTSVPVMLSNLTGADKIAVVFSYGSKGGLLQYNKGEKFNLNVMVGEDGLEIIEKVKDNSDTIELSDSKFNEGDDVVVMITDEDKTLTVTVGDESSSFSYGSGGVFWFISRDDDDDDTDIPYNVTIGSKETEGETLQGNIVTLQINDRHVDLSPYLITNNLHRCITPRSERKTKEIESPISERKQLAC